MSKTRRSPEETAIGYEYDANGNNISKSDGTIHTFDKLNRMTSYKAPDGTTTTYGYYPDNMRKSKKVGTTDELTQVWIGDEIALDITGSTTKSYIHGHNLICEGSTWYLYNAHGDVTALTNSNGEVTRNYDYDVFGVQLTEEDETDTNPYRYCGEYYDIESGYTYLQARYYDPNIGRFVSEDPALDGSNWYVYCGNDPINYIDPTGMWGENIHTEITKSVFYELENELRKSDYAKDALLAGCVFPDEARDNVDGIYTVETSEKYSDKTWHGKGKKYYKKAKGQLKNAKEYWRKGKYYKAYKAIGKGLHTIQDYYAHTVMLDGTPKRVGKVADGYFSLDSTGNVVAPNNMSSYIGADIIEMIGASDGASVHWLTADNPNVKFDGEKWVEDKAQSRYTSARDDTVTFLEKFIKATKKIDERKNSKKKKNNNKKKTKRKK